MSQDFDDWSWTPDWLPEPPPRSGWGLLAYFLVFVILAWAAAPSPVPVQAPPHLASASELAAPPATENETLPAPCSCLPNER